MLQELARISLIMLGMALVLLGLDFLTGKYKLYRP